MKDNIYDEYHRGLETTIPGNHEKQAVVYKR